MFDPSSIVVGLEIGTSKICAVVADVKPAGAFAILGVGQAESKGVRKGEIINATEITDLIHKALQEAEQMADVEIRSVWLGVTGAHIQALHNRGIHPIASADRAITADDVSDAVRNAKTINLPSHNHSIHLIRQHFIVDGQEGIEEPVGMLGGRIEADVLVVHGNFNRLQNAIRAVRSVQIDVEDVCFNGLASSLAVLTAEQKDLGALVIDFGGGTAEYVVTSGGIVRHAGVVAVGGDHVSHDLAVGLKLPLGRAENLKVEHGSAVIDDSVKGVSINLPSGEIGLPQRSVNLEHLRRIMSMRLEETFEIIAQRLIDAGMLDLAHAGVFLCGGGSRTPGLVRLAERIFQMPAHLGRINCVSGMTASLDEPEFATPIGLAKYGSFRAQQRLLGGSGLIERALKILGRP